MPLTLQVLGFQGRTTQMTESCELFCKCSETVRVTLGAFNGNLTWGHGFPQT